MGGEMDQAYARRMSGLTSDFYRRVASSFDATRQSPWQGWDRVLAEAGIEKRFSNDDERGVCIEEIRSFIRDLQKK